MKTTHDSKVYLVDPCSIEEEIALYRYGRKTKQLITAEPLHKEQVSLLSPSSVAVSGGYLNYTPMGYANDYLKIKVSNISH